MPNHPTPLLGSHSHWLAAGLCVLLPLAAPAQESGGQAPTDPAERPLRYVVGASVASGPKYAGGDGRSYGLRPAWAIESGRFRFSTSRGGALMGYGLQARDAGASATLAESDDFYASLSLGLDDGRRSSDAPLLVGLPDVRRTLRGKFSVGYAFTQRWSVGLGLSQDLLNHGGGAQLGASVGYNYQLTPQTKLWVSGGATFANSTYMNSYFSVPASAAGISTLPLFEARAGLLSTDLGLDWMTALDNPHWVVFGGLRLSQLHGDARRSPLTVRPNNYSASIGLAYRCCL